MQPSTWNDTNQHWLSQFLLKGFGIRKKASSVYELDKQTNAVMVRKVSEVASKPRLLTGQDDELMRRIESRAATAIDAIRKGNLNRIDENSRQTVDKLALALMLNDPYYGVDVESARETAIAEVVSALSKGTIKYGGILDEPDFTDFLDGRLPYDRLSGFMDLTTSQVLMALRLMGLQAFKPAEGASFIIGDSPALVIRGTMKGETNLLNPGSQIILPISSRCLLAYTWATETNLIDDGGTFDGEQVRSLNSDYYHGAKCRYIYGRDEETLRRSQLLPLAWTPRGRSNDVKSGWAAMQRLWQMTQNQHEAQNVVQARALEYAAHELVGVAIAQAQL